MSGQVKQMAIVFGVIVVIASAPVLSVVVASVIANACGCKLDEGNVHPCVVLGLDLGELLYAMGVTAWLALATVPLGAIALIFWAIVAIVMYVRYRKKMAAENV